MQRLCNTFSTCSFIDFRIRRVCGVLCRRIADRYNLRSKPLAHSIVEELKRSKPSGFFTRDEIGKVALAFLQANGQMGRKELAAKIMEALDLPEHHNNRVENAWEALERSGKISMPLGGNTVRFISM
jgi:hypothetical protein